MSLSIYQYIPMTISYIRKKNVLLVKFLSEFCYYFSKVSVGSSFSFIYYNEEVLVSDADPQGPNTVAYVTAVLRGLTIIVDGWYVSFKLSCLFYSWDKNHFSP